MPDALPVSAREVGAGSFPTRWRVAFKRRLLLAHAELQDWCCLYCRIRMSPKGRLAERPTLEHLEPASSLGPLTFANTAATCNGCNVDKGHLSDAEYRAVLEVRRRALGPPSLAAE